jgi:hypothetical protein
MAAEENGRRPADNPLKDQLKAVAGEPRKPADADPDKTALVNRRDPEKMGQLQNALKAVEQALGTTPGPAGKVAHAVTADEIPPTLAVRGAAADASKTRIVRGQAKPARSDYHQEPVVGWLVVIGGPGLGAFRPVFEGNNTIGRAASQRVAIDFGDDSISAEEQAYLRYDSSDRTFLFVPNLAKTNVVRVNEDKPTSAVRLRAMDVITMGQTQLVFVPFCGEDFDWSELADLDG